MEYVKPDIRFIGNAISVILGQPVGSKLGIVTETMSPTTYVTAAAYEADE